MAPTSHISNTIMTYKVTEGKWGYGKQHFYVKVHDNSHETTDNVKSAYGCHSWNKPSTLQNICKVKFWENRQLAPVAYLKHEQNVNEFPQHELLQFPLTISATSAHNLSSFTFKNPPK